jgi:hypothetical protein|nr:MAG TPA: hypothetical protein [Caudoviricetes sp.]
MDHIEVIDRLFEMVVLIAIVVFMKGEKDGS